MAQASKTFRIFVSSTFSDLKAERSALQEQVFPRLREVCAQHGARFQAIDLRWGVSEEASLDQQVMNICLDEIARCQQASPRPNFIVLLGDRYGWCPPPPQIPAREFEAILAHVSERDRDLLNTWYRRDDNAVPAEYLLQPRQQGSKYEDYASWEEVEEELHEILASAVEGMEIDEEPRLKYIASATHQEIAAGALKVEDAKEHVFCFFRTIKDLPQDSSAKEFLDLDKIGKPNQEAHGKLSGLKGQLHDLLKGNVHKYNAEWTRDGITTNHLERLCDDVYASLEGIILKELSKLEQIDPLQAEISAHQSFREDRARFFTGRRGILVDIGKYINSGSQHPLAVWGKSGSGKSALIAKAVDQTLETLPKAEVIERYIGATPESSNIRTLLDDLCRHINRIFGQEETIIPPSDFNELAQVFRKSLNLARIDKPLVIFLDALDQLSEAENAHQLSWIPTELPSHVKLILSTLPEPHLCLPSLRSKLPTNNLLELEAMSRQDGERVLKTWLEAEGRTLQDNQHREVLGKFMHNGLPLYLKLAFEEARRWRSYEGVPNYDDQTGLAKDISGIIRNLFSRLAESANHGEIMVSRGLGYLTAAKNGLGEDEMLDILSRDEEVMDDFMRRSPKSPEVDRLPVVIWSRLYFDLQPYLTERSADGSILMTFYHRQLGEVVGSDYLGDNEGRDRYTHLANYFDKQDLEITLNDETKPNLRKMSELPFQQAMGEMWDPLFETLTDFCFLERKAADMGVVEFKKAEGEKAAKTHTGIFLIRDDFDLALRKMAGKGIDGRQDRQGRIIVTAVDLGKGAGYQVRCPSCNRYSDLEEEWLGTEIGCPQEGCGKPLKLNPFMVPTHEGFTHPPKLELEQPTTQTSGSLLEQPPQRYTREARTTELTIAERRDVLEVFNATIGRESHTLQRSPEILWQQLYNRLQWEQGLVPHVLEPELRRRRTPGDTPWLRTRNRLRESEAHQRIFSDHTDMVRASAISPDGSSIVSGGVDTTLRLWDLATGEEIRTLEGHADMVSACAVAPDGSFLVSASDDKTLCLWDPRTGEKNKTLIGHAGPVTACAFFPDSNRLASASWDCTVKLWDLERGKVIDTLEGHLGYVSACAVSPDGSFIVSGSWDGTLRIWNPETGKELHTLRDHDDRVYSCAISPDGSWIVSASMDGTLRIWDATNGQVLRTLRGHTAEIYGCAISPDSSLVVSASGDHTLRLWDPFTGEQLNILEGHTRDVANCSFSPDGKWIVSASTDHTLRVWSAITDKTVQERKGHTERVNACKVPADGSFVISGSDDGTLRIWDSSSGEEQQTLQGHNARVWDCAVTSDGSRVVSASVDTTLRVWDPITGDPITEKVVRIMKGHSHEVLTCALSPDDSLVVSGSADKTLLLWDLSSGEKIRSLEGHTSDVIACAFSPDGSMVISASGDKTLRLWDLASGKTIRQFVGHTDLVFTCDISPDGSFAVSAGGDKTLRLWDLATGEERLCLRGHTDEIWGCAVSPDGLYVISASWDNSVRIWSAVTGQALTTLILRGMLQCIAIYPNGDNLVTGDSGGAIHLIELVGFEFASPIVTAVKHGEESIIRCPVCFQEVRLKQEWLGTEIACPALSCGSKMRINPFVANSADARTSQ